MASGYRPCMRCKPIGERPEARLAADICSYLEHHRDRTITLSELASRFERSPFTIQRRFEQVVGVSPSRYQAQLRFAAAREGLIRGAGVTEAIFHAGYVASSRFYDRAAKSLGMEPSRLRKGAPGEEVHFSAARCALGVIQVASTRRGLCSVMLGDDRRELEKELRRDFPKANLLAGGSETYLQDVLDRIEGGKSLPDLPVDVRGTAFQARVWEALRRIPRGQTRSYSGVARSIGKPRAVRAVARACALNPISIVVPCHRVVGSDGSLTGYRWGIERKRKLLEMEREKA